MCLIALALRVDPRWPLILAANRDEFHDRPSAPSAWWEDAPHLYGGRDLTAGGTWLGLARHGRAAALTNFREPAGVRGEPARSRGEVLRNFLSSDEDVEAWAKACVTRLGDYAGFNALLFDWQSGANSPEGWYLSNRHPDQALAPIQPGIHGLSNHLLGTRWPKVQRLCAAMDEALRLPGDIESRLLDALADGRPIEAHERAAVDPGAEQEVLIRTPFIADGRYGTRASTVVMVGADHTVRFFERTWDWHEDRPRMTGERSMQLPPADATGRGAVSAAASAP